ncbi:FAD dependent oxidoreductase [Halteromyces radiatus]|uniref:FAD dependent oxidoreductase n=1 Tax=Halteromyces radiatus TaxID=101107 RepID=UPI00221E974A|nr:FAD dependent oxidoreductase [Halteromyces radiatus]KAI8089627.1 FAD dependent oxidoreductase [Halteromyces radiatus]
MTIHVLIIGAGAIGTCTAYYLSQREDIQITVVERCKVASASSGKAGGFLWSEGDGILSLKSYNLHKELAEALDGEKFYGYRTLDTYSVTMTSQENEKDAKQVKKKVNDNVPWLNQERVTTCDELGNKNETAQVHPKLFTITLMTAAEATGNVKLICGNGVKELLYDDYDSELIRGVLLDNGDKILADHVVACVGPWAEMFPIKLNSSSMMNDAILRQHHNKNNNRGLPITSARAHSIVIRVPRTSPIGAQALFTCILDGSKMYEPEVYPRPDHTVYMCGIQDRTVPLPPTADLVKVDPKAIDRLKYTAGLISPHLDTREQNLLAEQACYLPISLDGSPLVGKHPNYKNLYISGGHSVWGILLSPVSGLMMTELLMDGKITCVPQDLVKKLSLDSRLD